MKKGIFAHRKINVNQASDSVGTYEGGEFSWEYPHGTNVVDEVNLRHKDNVNDYSMDYLVKRRYDNDRLERKFGFLPNELAAYIDDELKLVEEKSALMQMELLARFNALKESLSKVTFNGAGRWWKLQRCASIPGLS